MTEKTDCVNYSVPDIKQEQTNRIGLTKNPSNNNKDSILKTELKSNEKGPMTNLGKSQVVKPVGKINFIYIYSRVSSKSQSKDLKLGLQTQKAICEEYFRNNYPNTEVGYWADVGSSYKNNKILKECGSFIQKLKPNSLIVVSEVSRLGRSFSMVKTLLDKVKKTSSFIVSVSENLIYGSTKISDSKFIKRVMDAQKESDVLSQRIKNTQKYIRNAGGYIGKPPFGYKIVKNFLGIPVLQKNPLHFKFIDLMVDYIDQSYTYKQIANILNEQNLLLNDKKWNHLTIKKILLKFYPEHINNLVEGLEGSIEIYENHQMKLESNYIELRSRNIIKY
jgi:DNA invertase Pin-like site-specific DNA recombinase